MTTNTDCKPIIDNMDAEGDGEDSVAMHELLQNESIELEAANKAVETAFRNSDETNIWEMPSNPDDSPCVSFFSDKNTSRVGRSTEILKTWTFSNVTYPYPTEQDKLRLQKKCSMNSVQLRNWFNNLRKRHWSRVKNGMEPRSYTELVLAHELVRMNAIDTKRRKLQTRHPYIEC